MTAGLLIRIRHSRPRPSDAAPVERSPAVTARRLELAGISHRDAETMAGYTVGLLPVGSGWTLHEIQALLFLRATAGRWR